LGHKKNPLIFKKILTQTPLMISEESEGPPPPRLVFYFPKVISHAVEVLDRRLLCKWTADPSGRTCWIV